MTNEQEVETLGIFINLISKYKISQADSEFLAKNILESGYRKTAPLSVDRVADIDAKTRCPKCGNGKYKIGITEAEAIIQAHKEGRLTK